MLVLTGIGMTIVGLAFKASLAPFHQWTPDVYEGAPTPVTAYMSVATKIAAFAVIIRLFDVALLPAVDDWRPVWIAIAVISILIGNVGALGQSSLKRMLAYSSIAQAGYILVGRRRRDASSASRRCSSTSPSTCSRTWPRSRS